ncbi:MAG TPA: AgmX/PglI C-terminal domain-containing protein [Gemmatimonadaceae bacterium]|nr:AgmX/PglI C-terminal domain-containing protein [Gemmatimonadaceae bacterium]
MRRRLILSLFTLAIAAPSISAAQTRKGPPPAPQRDTLAVALVSTDTVAAGQVERVVRGRHREVQFCFEESGLKTDPELSGTFAMVLTLDTLGGVSRVDPSWREWSGPDGTAVESCVMQRALTWKFPGHLARATPRHEVTFQFSR